jgi:nickel/cobalt transporter (NiCoT) family protein
MRPAAFLAGTVEVLGVLTDEPHLPGTFWAYRPTFDINKARFTIAGLFVVVRMIALAVGRFGKIRSCREIAGRQS